MKKRQRGFTLIEIMTALGIVALIGAVSVPLVSRLQRSQRFRSTAREMASELMRAKNLAGSGKRDTVTWVATDRTVQAGLRVQSTNTYSVFVDRDTINDGDELMVRAITLPYRMEIV